MNRFFNIGLLFLTGLILLFHSGCDESTSSQRTKITIKEIWWTDAVDLDQDGFNSELRFNFDLDVNKSEDVGVVVKLGIRPVGTDTFYLYFTSSQFYINGNTPDDARSILLSESVGNFTLPQYNYDFLLQVFPAGVDNEMVASLDADTEPMMANIPMETQSEDSPQQLEVYSTNWTNLVDNDGDGYYSSITMNIDIDVTEGSVTAFMKFYYKLSGSSNYTFLANSSSFIVDGYSSSDARAVEFFNFPQGTYDFMIEVFKQGESIPDVTVDKFDFTNLGGWDLEPTIDDPAESGIEITFNNMVHTPIEVEIYGYGIKTAPVGGSAVWNLSTNPGSFTYHAETSGETSTGSQIGLLMEWNNTKDVTGQTTAAYNLIIGPDYFFIKVRNNGTDNLTPFYVNYGNSYQTVDNIILYNNNVQYNTGYYRAIENSTQVRSYFQSNTSSYVYWDEGTHFNLPFTNNQLAELWNSNKKTVVTDVNMTDNFLKHRNYQTLKPAETPVNNHKNVATAVDEIAVNTQ